MMNATSGIGTSTYQVNALGQRFRKTNSLVSQAFVYDVKGHLISESTTDGLPVREYVLLGNTPVAVGDSTGVFSVHADHLNTPRFVADAAGTTVWKWDQQEPFGNNVADENPSGIGAFDLPLRLPGQYFDKETNLHYNYFRDYDPLLGRYEQSDPAGLRAGLNTYAYVMSSPLRYVDPKGDISILEVVGAALGGYALWQVGDAATSGISAYYNCRWEQDIVELAKAAFNSCMSLRGKGENCDCTRELDQLKRSQQRLFTVCGLQFGGIAGGVANRTGGYVPGMATR